VINFTVPEEVGAHGSPQALALFAALNAAYAAPTSS
jgi:hypothetical protein